MNKGTGSALLRGRTKGSEIPFPRCSVDNLLPWFSKEIRTLKLLDFRGK